MGTPAQTTSKASHYITLWSIMDIFPVSPTELWTPWIQRECCLSLAQYLKCRHWNISRKNNLQPLLSKNLSYQTSRIIFKEPFWPGHLFPLIHIKLYSSLGFNLELNFSYIPHFHLSAISYCIPSYSGFRTCLFSLQSQIWRSFNLKCPESVTHLTLKCQFPGNSHGATPCSWNMITLETQ